MDMKEKYTALINNIECIVVEGREGKEGKPQPDYPHRYYLRHRELDWSEPCSIERFVLVNFFGIAYASQPLLSDGQEWADVESFVKEEVS